MEWIRKPPEGSPPILDPDPDRHAYVMLGTKKLFLCHITMFHMQEHMFQQVLHVSLPKVAMDVYVADRAEHPTAPYFLGNSDLDRLTLFSLHLGQITAFTADIFRGIPYQREYEEWPWNGVEPLISNVTVSVVRELYYRHFDFNLNYPRTLTYVIFGSGSEAHLTHYQVKEPDFDHILSLAKAPSWLPSAALESASHINFPDFPPNLVDCKRPLTDGSQSVQYCGQEFRYPIEIGTTYWFSTKIVNEDNPCPDPPSGTTDPGHHHDHG